MICLQHSCAAHLSTLLAETKNDGIIKEIVRVTINVSEFRDIFSTRADLMRIPDIDRWISHARSHNWINADYITETLSR